MNKTKHTPGPWHIAPSNFIVADCIDDDPTSGKIVAEVPCQGGNPADLPLIAAAPELLAACKRLLAQMNGIPDYSRVFSVEDYTIVQDAIAKAEGRNG